MILIVILNFRLRINILKYKIKRDKEHAYEITNKNIKDKVQTRNTGKYSEIDFQLGINTLY